MAEIKLDHNGHEITFREDQDAWCCFALDLKDASLKKLRTKINAVDADARRATEAVYLLRTYREPQRGMLVLRDADGQSGWMTFADGNRTKREKVSLSDIAPAAPEVEAALKEWKRLSDLRRQAEEDERAALKAIPRLAPPPERKGRG